MRTQQLLSIAIFILILLGFVGLKPTQTQAESQQPEETPLNVILLIGDGMGEGQIELTRLVEKGEGGVLSMETIEQTVMVDTSSLYQDYTDSAAAATALATGHKAPVGYLSYGPDGEIYNTILEIAKYNNKSTGVVSTTAFTHATPAGFVVHVENRGRPTPIVEQFFESGIDVVLAGGSSYMSDTRIDIVEGKDYSYVTTVDEMNAVTDGKIFGTFGLDNVPYIQDRTSAHPTLPQMTTKALDLLGQGEEGFFLMVEGGLIDYACHDNRKDLSVLENIEFDETVQVVLDFIEENPNTLLIVTADHETGGLSVVDHDLGAELPAAGNTAQENISLRLERVNDITTNWTTVSHSTADVRAFVKGMELSSFTNQSVINNTEIFDLMVYYMDPVMPEGPLYTTPETTTSLGTTTKESTSESASASNLMIILSIPTIYCARVFRRRI